jgi:hypothetical protein
MFGLFSKAKRYQQRVLMAKRVNQFSKHSHGMPKLTMSFQGMKKSETAAAKKKRAVLPSGASARAMRSRYCKLFKDNLRD